MSRSSLDTDRFSALRSRASIPVQGPSLRAIPVASCLHQGRSSPCTVKGSRHSYPQLPRRLAHLAQSRALLCEHRDMVLSHLSRLGLQVNREKSKLSPTQRISFLGMELDSVNLTARLSEERAQSMLRCLESSSTRGRFHWNIFRGSWGIWHPQPLSRRSDCFIWDRFSVGFTTESRDGHGATAYRVSLTPSCRRTFSPWSDLAFLRAGVPLEQVSRHVVVNRPLPRAGGPCATGTQPQGSGQGPSCSGISIASSCWQYGLLCAASERCYTRSILVRSDNTATVAYINHQGLRSRRMSQLARHLLLWSQKHLRSLRAVHVPGELNRAADELSSARPSGRMATPPRGTPADLELRGRSGRPVCLPGHVHCQCFSPCPRGPSVQMRWHAAGLGAYANMRFPQWAFSHRPCARSGRTRSKSSWCALLAQSDLVPRTDAPRDSPSLANSSEEGSTFSEGAPSGTRPDLWNLHVWSLDGTRRF